MKTDWTVFEGQQFPRGARTDQVRVTLHRSGVFYLNRVAYQALGGPQAVELLYNHNARVLGMRAVDARRKNAFAVRRHDRGKYNAVIVRAASFFQHLRLSFDRTMQFESVDLDDAGVLRLDLDRAVTISRGAR